MKLKEWLATMPRGTSAWIARECDVPGYTIRDVSQRDTPISRELAERISACTSGVVPADELYRGRTRRKIHSLHGGPGRKVRFAIALTAEEYETIVDAADVVGMGVAEYMRVMALGGTA